METRTITRTFVLVSDLENFILGFDEEMLSQFAEKLFLKHYKLDLKASMLKYTPANIIQEIMFRKNIDTHNMKMWRKLEQQWLEYLSEYNVEDIWLENFEKQL